MRKSQKEDILRLRAEGMTYDQIREATGASKGTIAYHCGEGQKEKTKARVRAMREAEPLLSRAQQWLDKKVIYNVSHKANGFVHKNNSQPKSMVDAKLDVKNLLEYVKQHDVCYLSGRPINYDDPSSFHFDHKIPTSRGGLNTLENLGVTTKEANQAKSDMTLDELLDLCYDILKHHGRL